MQIQSIIKQSVLSLYLVYPFLLTGCGSEEPRCIEAPNVSNIEAPVTIERLDLKFKAATSAEEVHALIVENRIFATEFLGLNPYTDDSLLAVQYFDLLQNPGIDTLYMEVEAVFGDMEEIRLSFEEAFKHVKYFFPDFEVPAIKTVVTGFSSDMYLSDSLIIFGLDYYLGPQGSYLPQDVPGYILKRYQKPYMVPQTLMLISDFYIQSAIEDNTALAEMIYYGKAYQFVKQMMPCVSDSLITGYTTEEMQDIKKYESVIWASMIENQFVYETNHMIKQKILGESPQTFDIGEKCPGRIGRWTGWRIVQQYLKANPEVQLPELLQNTDAQMIFSKSKYKPG
ncbi:MAG: gliding motility lipoprotein GldB [Cyclobacteriaceae bacterium]